MSGEVNLDPLASAPALTAFAQVHLDEEEKYRRTHWLSMKLLDAV
jgi:hypothetical protein